MARPKKVITEQQMSLIEGLAAVLTMDQIADFLGMARSTFYERIAEDQNLRELIDSGLAKGVANVARRLAQDALNGNTTAQIFFLKCRGGWRETQRVELTGRDGKAIEMAADRAIDETKLTLDQKRALLAAVISDEASEDAADES